MRYTVDERLSPCCSLHKNPGVRAPATMRPSGPALPPPPLGGGSNADLYVHAPLSVLTPNTSPALMTASSPNKPTLAAAPMATSLASSAVCFRHDRPAAKAARELHV